ncbi:MAG: hypothetical protein KY437_00820 [Actinobacteria bacterium]|nr:hypothetical protein [Actinomycetota bacterium]
MKVSEVIEHTAATIVAIPAVSILLDVLFRLLGAREDNVIVDYVREAADLAIPRAAATMFTDQAHWQTATIALVIYLIVGIALVYAIRGLTSAFEAQDRTA